MKVIILQDRLRGGGTERQAVALAAALRAEGLPAGLWVGWRGSAWDHFAERQLGEALAFLSDSDRASHIGILRRLRRRIAAEKAPICLVLMGRWAHLAANFVSSRSGPGVSFIGTVRTSRPLPWLYLRSIRRSRLLIANSHWALSRIPQVKRRDNPTKGHVIHNGLSRPELLEIPEKRAGVPSAAEPRTILLNVARLEPGKGQEDLIRMLPLIPQPGVELWLAGTGPETDRLKALCIELGLGDKVRFRGFTEDVASLYAAADIFVSASQLDSLPNAVIEAQAAALPVVAYGNFGLPEIVIDGTSGFLCREHGPAALAERVTALIEAPKKRLAFGRAGRTHMKIAFDPATQNRLFCQRIEQSIRDGDDK